MAATASTFAALQQRVTPRWMKRPKVKALVSQLYLQADAVVDRMAGAITARCVALCPDDALDAIGATCALPRAVGESDADYRAYLRDPFARWAKAGTDAGLIAELTHAGLRDVQIWDHTRIITELGVPDDLAFNGITSYFFILAKAPALAAAAVYNDGSKYRGGALWGLGGASRALIESWRRVVREWKAGGTSCRFLILDLDGTTVIDPGLGSGWGAGFSGNFVILPMHEKWEEDATGAYTESFNYSYMQETT